MTRLAAVPARVEAAAWSVVVATALVLLRPAAIVVDVIAPRLRPLRTRAGHYERRTS